MDDQVDDGGSKVSTTRRHFFRSLGAIPVVIAALPGCSNEQRPAAAPSATGPAPYQPTFFTQPEWTFVVAVVDRLIPTDDLGPGAVEVGVPEFLDRHMKTPYAAGDIWYLQGPFHESSPQFGYQGRLPLRDILRVGIKAFDDYCVANHGGKTFAQLGPAEQDQLLTAADTAKLKLADISAKTFFDYLLNETKAGYFADPSHGGNQGMAGWKAIAYPGVRADYIDWVTVRDKPYPLPPVDLAGKRA